MVFYIEGTAVNENCFCRKNKTNGINIQCPYKKKFGDYCGRHKSDTKWRYRIDVPLGDNQEVVINNSIKVLITEKDYLEDNELSKFNFKSIRYSIKKYKLTFNSNKLIMCYNLAYFFENIISFQKYDKEARIIQKNFKLYLKNRNKFLRGPALNNRELCNNKEDFLSFEPLENLNNNIFFSYIDEDKFIYGFDIHSFEKLIAKKMSNPYNRKPIPKRAIKNMETIIKLEQIHEIEETPNYTLKQKITHRIIKIFQEIDRLGTYAGGTDINWFLSMEVGHLKCYYKTLEDIWNYRANLTNVQKSHIVPYQVMFPYTVYNYNKLTNMKKMKDLLLTEMEKLVFSAELDSDKSLGCYYILIAFVEINPICASLMPWLVQ